MSTTDDLRATLDAHAARLTDHDLHARPVAVRERIRVTQRRRRGAAAAALAVVLAVTGLGLVPLLGGDRPDPAGPPHRLAGHTVPGEATVLGFGYRYTRAVIDASEPVSLPASDGRRVVSLATDGLGGGAATLYADGQPVARSSGDGSLERPVPVSTYATRLRVRLHDAPADARVALAVYERDGSLPAGVDDGTAVFREEATGDRLLTGAFGEPGQAELTLTFTGSLGDVRFSEYCRPDGPRLWLKMEIDDEGWTGGPCSAGDPGEDAGAYGTSLSPGSAREQHTVRLWVTRAQAGRRGTPVANPGTVIGLGIYSLQGERRVSHGVEVPPVVEWNGRSWTWAGTIEPPAGARALRRSLDTADGPLLVGFAARRSVVVLSADGGLVPDQSMQFNARSTSGGGPQMELLAGDSYSVSLREVRAGHALDGALVVYRPAD